MARANPRRRNAIFRLVIALLLAGVAYFTYQELQNASFLKINDVAVVGLGQNMTGEEIVSAVSGKNLLFFPEKTAADQILRNPLISSVRFDRIFPAKMKVTVTLRTPEFSWQGSNGRFLVSQDGVIFAPADSEQVIQVGDPQAELKLGDKVEERKLALLEKVLAASADKFTILTASFTGADLTATLSSNITVYFPGGKDLSQSSSALQLILQKAKIDGRLPRIIDLRYDKPLVTY